MTFTGIQTLGVFQQMSISWFEPLQTLFRVVSLLSFDLKMLKVSCVFGTDPIFSYAVRQMIVPMSVPFILVTLLIKKRDKPNTVVPIELINTIGTVFSVFFISIVLSGISPMICYPHPPGNGRSMIMGPSIVCSGFEGSWNKHTSMAMLGFLALLVSPLPFFVMACYATWKYPSWIARYSPITNRRLQAFRFLFFRFKPSRYYYGVIMLCRSLLVCLVPVVLSDDVALQISFMVFFTCMFLIIQQHVMPWHMATTNLIDGMLNVMLVMMLVTGSMATEIEASSNAIRYVGTAAFSMTTLGLLAGISYGFMQWLRPSPMYHMFICHHKGHAAAQARLLKVVLQAQLQSHQQVFIDSDDLKELDQLFDTVKSRVRHLVVYLTSETLSRPWCTGEIVTAFRAGVKVTPVVTPSFVAPTEDQLARMDQYLDITSCNLLEYNISFRAVSEAVSSLLADDKPKIHMNTKVKGSMRFSAIADELLGRKSSSASLQAPKLKAKPGMVVVSVDDQSDEAIASASILVNKIQQQVFAITDDGICVTSDFDFHGVNGYEELIMLVAMSRATIVLLSEGSLRSVLQLGVIMQAMDSQGLGAGTWPVVLPVNTSSFKFPAADYYARVLPRVWEGDSDHAAERIQSFFNRITIFLATAASDAILNTQCSDIVERIPKEQTLRESTMEHPSSERENESGDSSTNSYAFLMTRSIGPAVSMSQQSCSTLSLPPLVENDSSEEGRAQEGQEGQDSNLQRVMENLDKDKVADIANYQLIKTVV